MISRDLLIKKIAKAIEVYPSTIELKREQRTDDGMGGYIIDGVEDVATFKAFLDCQKSSISVSISEGGKVVNYSNIRLIVPYSNDFKILKGDTFSLDGVTYRVKNPNLQLDVCYLAELEVL